MRGIDAVACVAAAALFGCSGVRMVQRDGCWVRQSKKLGIMKEELGPCTPPAPSWSEDRLTRLVQECAVRADHRWRTLAISAFQRGAPIPERMPDDALQARCVEEATRLAAAQSEAELASLRAKLAEADAERGKLRERADEERAALVARAEKDHEAFVARDGKERDALAESTTKLAEWLGKAASKPTQPAVATATASSDGRARTDSEQRQPASFPWTPPAPVDPARASVARGAKPRAPAVPARSGKTCDVPVTPAAAPTATPPAPTPTASATPAAAAPPGTAGTASAAP